MSVEKVQPKTLPGFMELLPADQIEFNRLRNIIQATYELFGFVPLDTPIIERADVLLAKAGGETEQQIYQFKKGDNDLALRFDLTVPLAKYVAKNYKDLNFPFRRYQIGKVFRGERSQKGRFREFYQCDIDVIGNGELDLINDAEILAIIYNVFKKLNFGDFQIKINNRKILGGYFGTLGITNKTSDILRIIDKLQKISKDNVLDELSGIIDKSTAVKVLDFVTINGSNKKIIDKLKEINANDLFKTGVDELEEVLQYVYNFGVAEESIAIDLTIARGLGYYTGTVYETFLKDYPRIGSVCSGGRFDDLAEYYTDKKLPGVGISIGLTRLFYQLKEAGIIKSDNKSTSKVLIIPLINDLTMSLQIATKLRQENVPTEVYFDVDAKSKKKFSYADKMGIPFAVVIGEEEVKQNMVTLKNMKTGEQAQVGTDELIEAIS